jgi:putative ABC transport system permease protein
MFKNYLKIAMRTILRNRVFSSITIAGFAIGLAFSMLILLWIYDEVSFDQFHENINNLYIAGTHAKFGSRTITDTGTPPALGPALKEEYPEIINSARLNNGQASVVLGYGDKKFREQVQPADGSFLEMFTFKLLKGDQKTALSSPHSIVMTKEMATKYFGDKDPLGEIINFDNRFDYKVTGIIEEIPHNSSIQFSCLIPVDDLEELWKSEDYLRSWGNLSFQTYVQLKPNTSLQELNAKIVERINQSSRDNEVELFLTPYKNYHLHYLGFGGGASDTVGLFSIIALIILLIACINFMNLTTAKSVKRAKEIGLRKVVGAAKRNIMAQFFGESILTTLLALSLALVFVFVLLQYFNSLTGKEIETNFFLNPKIILGFVGLTILTGLIAGSYPACYMSSFRPIKIIKSYFTSSKGNESFRRYLVVIQFVSSIILIIGTIIIYRQIDYFKTREVGFQKDFLIQVPINRDYFQNFEAVRLQLLTNANVINATVTSHSPAGIYWNGSNWDWEGRDPNINPLVTYFSVDENFPETFGTKMKYGRFLTIDDALENLTDVSGAVVINEEFARIMGEENPVGKRLSQPEDNEYHVIAGVIKDFNFKPLWQNIDPMIIYLHPKRFRYLFIRIQPNNVSATLDHIKKVYHQFYADFPYEYSFFNETYERIYRSFEEFANIIKAFALLAIIISSLGIFGLSFFVTEKRTKEIGVRKVLGATISSVTLLLSKEFLRLILLSNIIAWPIAWWLMSRWLNDYAYHINIGLAVFLITGLLSVLITFIAVGYQSVKAAVANPVESLRYE